MEKRFRCSHCWASCGVLVGSRFCREGQQGHGLRGHVEAFPLGKQPELETLLSPHSTHTAKAAAWTGLDLKGLQRDRGKEAKGKAR